MTSQRTRFVLISLTSAALCGVLTAAPAAAAPSPCKGLAQAQCGTTEGCGWIDTYTRKDGRTVEGYCKKATLPPGAKQAHDQAAAAMPAPAPAATPAAPAAPKPATGAARMPAQPQ